MFKVWKSIFSINKVKKVKIERFKCFLYGRLISLLLASSIVFTAKNIIIDEDDKEISEIKAFGHLVQYFPKLCNEIFKGELSILRFMKQILANFKKLGLKSRKKHKKITLDILKSIALELDQLEELAS